MKNILVIGAGDYQIKGIKKLKEKGYQVIAVDGNPNAAGKKFADYFFNIDILNVDEIISIVQKQKIKLYSCLCFATEIAIRTVGRINDHFSLVGINSEMAVIGNDKFIQRKLMTELCLPVPKFVVLDKNTDVKSLIVESKLSFPVIIKPTDNSGSRGVEYITNLEQLNKRIKKVFDYTLYKDKLLIEEYINGIEFTIESLISHRVIYTLAVSEKRKLINNYTVSIELFYQSPLVNKLFNKIIETVNKFLLYCGFNNTILHTEAIYSFKDDEIYIIETAVRSGGFKIFDEILPAITGKDIIGLTIDTLLAKNVSLEIYKRRPTILRFFSGNQGVLKKITIMEKLIDELSEIKYDFFYKPNDTIPSITTDGSRLGYLVSTADTWQEAFTKANIVEYAIKFEIV